MLTLNWPSWSKTNTMQENTPDSDTLNHLLTQLQSDDISVREAAAGALGMIESEQAVQPLIDALQDESAEVRKEAAWALGEMGSEQAILPLIDALQDGSSEVRRSVLIALGGINRSNKTLPRPPLLFLNRAPIQQKSSDAMIRHVLHSQAVYHHPSDEFTRK